MKKAIVLLGILSFLIIPFLTQAASAPPPPPPPCAQKLQGCYDQDDIRKGAGSLSIENFGYYIEQTACIAGGCRCSLSSFVEDVRKLNPDESAGACGCLIGTSWANVNTVNNVSNSCCGDDLADCGVISSESSHGQVIEQHLCAMNSDFIGTWIPANPHTGDIAFLGCNQKEYLSYNEIWEECNEFKMITVENHEYLCTAQTGQGNGWVECCGSDACNSKSGGARLFSGNSVTVGNTVYYCTSDSTFSTNLDNTDKTSCEGADFDWTGALCCSEADDEGEYYNDIGKGGCWNKETVFTGNPVPSQPGVANFDGQFFGCNVQDAELLSLIDYHTGDPLIENKDWCFQDAQRFYLCKVDGTWEQTSGKDFSHLSVVPFEINPDPIQEGSCCAPDRCWDGAQCVENQRFNPNAPSVNGFRCIDGNWTTAELKISPEEDVGGFCPESSQCLVSPFGNANDNNNPDGNPQCIADGQYTNNAYCEEGHWTSRTKFIAQYFLELAETEDNFVVFCDKPTSTLNNVNYEIKGVLAQTLIDSNANNFCVFSKDDTILLGTTLNTGLETDDSLLDILGVDDCSNAYTNTEDSYIACGGASTSKAWYNAKLKSVIYSAEPFLLPSDLIFSNLRETFNNLVSGISSSTLQRFDVVFNDNLKRFEKLYISKRGDKEIRGTVEGFSSKRLVIEYKNFDTNICDFIETYNDKFSDAGSKIACEQKDNIYFVVSEGSEFTKINPDLIWNDLTSKLRIS